MCDCRHISVPQCVCLYTRMCVSICKVQTVGAKYVPCLREGDAHRLRLALALATMPRAAELFAMCALKANQYRNYIDHILIYYIFEIIVIYRYTVFVL